MEVITYVATLRHAHSVLYKMSRSLSIVLQKNSQGRSYLYVKLTGVHIESHTLMKIEPTWNNPEEISRYHDC